ncbi:hypothetical protein C4K40_1812 [Pseudomonas sp. CMR5c]|nr:hypothetical protein C4K40_1812 [Pseudomonas sp. CMR5c]
MRMSRLRTVLLALAIVTSPLTGTVHAGSKQLTLTVAAAITPGCRLGSGQADVSTYGVLDLGTVANLEQAILASSSVGAGTIVVNCTPGTDYRISLNDGLWSDSAGGAGRRLKSSTSSGNAFLPYYLFQDAGYSKIWADGTFAKSGLAKGGPEEFPVYILVEAASIAIPPGVYTDTVLVTVSY